MKRATASVPPPAPQGTTIVSGRFGYCAKALAPRHSAAMANRARKACSERVIVSPPKVLCGGPRQCARREPAHDWALATLRWQRGKARSAPALSNPLMLRVSASRQNRRSHLESVDGEDLVEALPRRRAGGSAHRSVPVAAGAAGRRPSQACGTAGLQVHGPQLQLRRDRCPVRARWRPTCRAWGWSVATASPSCCPTCRSTRWRWRPSCAPATWWSTSTRCTRRASWSTS